MAGCGAQQDITQAKLIAARANTVTAAIGLLACILITLILAL